MCVALQFKNHSNEVGDIHGYVACPGTWKKEKEVFFCFSLYRILELTEEHRSKVLCFLLHSADISNPAKPWDIHNRWTTRIMEEFFQQGDREKQLSLPPSPLCDRNTTSIPESQLGNNSNFFASETNGKQLFAYQ